jgi:hypothetical protein
MTGETSTEHADLQVLLQMYQTARDLVATKESALQQVLAWGAALLLGSTLAVLGVIEAGKDVLPWAQQTEWALLVVVSTAIAFQYAGESANLARLGAYAHRIECSIGERTALGDIPLYEHWSRNTRHWVQQQLGISGLAWIILVIGLQAIPFIFATARTEFWPLLLGIGVLISVVAPAAYGLSSNHRYEKELAQDDERAAKARSV